MKRIYLDNASTTRMDETVLEEMLPFLKDEFGNPSSHHRLGEVASDAIERSRESIAKSVNVKPSQVIFTSGGTEACNIGVGMGCCVRDGDCQKRTIMISPIEHPAVRESAISLRNAGFSLIETDVSNDGIVNPLGFQPSGKSASCLFALMHANNELGVIQPVEEVAKIAKDCDVPFFVDCVQSYLKLPMDFRRLGASGIAVSAHKIHGPKGVGALIVSEDAKIKRLVFGGDQESGLRAGTPSVANIVGFGAAVRSGFPIDESVIRNTERLRNRLTRGLIESIPVASLNGSAEKRICHIASIAFDGVEARTLLEWLDEQGVIASAGSACTSRRLEPSRILTAIGLAPLKALGTVRFSLDACTSRDDIDEAVDLVRRGVSFLMGNKPPNGLAAAPAH